jgi:hypothetical protein
VPVTKKPESLQNPQAILEGLPGEAGMGRGSKGLETRKRLRNDF